MALDDRLGRSATLRILRIGSPGAFLGERESERESEGKDEEGILLLGSEIPPGAEIGDELEVFVYLDSSGRPLATTAVPRLERGEVAFLTVTELTQFGAFVDWGLPKELLVPFAEQTTELRVGARQPIGLYLDSSGRLAGTMRVSEMLDAKRRGEQVTWTLDEWVEGEAWRNEPGIGLFVIVKRAYVGLVPSSETHTLTRGQAARFRVAMILPDNKIELSLRGHAHEEMANDATAILDALETSGAGISERASPEEIRERFGISRKAFKRAVGKLLKERQITIDGAGVIRMAANAAR